MHVDWPTLLSVFAAGLAIRALWIAEGLAKQMRDERKRWYERKP